MSEQEIFEKVKAIIVENLGIERDKVTSKASFGTDLGADSLDNVELVMALEEAFNIEIPDEIAQEFVTVQQVIDYISQKFPVY